MAFDKIIDSVALDAVFSDIAGAIRTKSGTMTQYTPVQMAMAVMAIGEEAGGETDDSFKEVIEGTAVNPTLPYDLTSIRQYAFCCFANLALTSLPSGVTNIGEFAFGSCTSLVLTSLPSGVTSIGDNAFNYCTSLALTSLPSGVTRIGNSTFYRCTSLALTSIPSGVTSIGNYAFQYCTRLTTLTFEGKPNSISTSAFRNCTNLTTINVPWAEGEVANAPWGATNATINYNYTGG